LGKDFVTDDKVLLFKLHPCSSGLGDDALEEIADAAEIVRCEAGHVICQVDEPVSSVYLIVHGRLRLRLFDIQGRVAMQRFQSAGGQFGGLSATLAEPMPVNCTAEDPSVLLRFDYAKSLELTKKYDAFRKNFTRLIYASVKQALFNEKTAARPRLIAFFHQSDTTRVVSRKILQRLVDLGESPYVFTDRSVDIAGMSGQQVFTANQEFSAEEVRRETKSASSGCSRRRKWHLSQANCVRRRNATSKSSLAVQALTKVPPS
jgi:CRP-like cAMP-binding protein